MSPDGPPRLDQLDALRAFAVAAVLLSHFSATLGALPVGLGTLGVRLFFVLSGFLITGILLRSGLAADADDPKRILGRFYVRRALRILPAYYALIAISAAFNIELYRSTFWWHATYLSNFLFAAKGQWLGVISHLWSLAVEEQFYLVWPWLLWATPRRRQGWLFACACLVGPLSRAAMLQFAPDIPIATTVLTPACFDFLGAGALLAWAWQAGWRTSVGFKVVRWIGAALLTIALAWQGSATMPNWIALVLLPFAHAWGFAVLVDAAAQGFGGPAGAVLRWRPLLWLGQISYGVYLFHNNANWIGPKLLRVVTGGELSYFRSESGHVIYYCGLSLLAAIASWYCIERPCNRLKDRFPMFARA